MNQNLKKVLEWLEDNKPSKDNPVPRELAESMRTLKQIVAKYSRWA